MESSTERSRSDGGAVHSDDGARRMRGNREPVREQPFSPGNGARPERRGRSTEHAAESSGAAAAQVRSPRSDGGAVALPVRCEWGICPPLRAGGVRGGRCGE